MNNPQKQKKSLKLVIKTNAGLEQVLVEELEQLGARDIQAGRRVVSCWGNNELIYKCNLWLRTALRVLVPITSFKAKNEKDLYHRAHKIDWSRVFTTSQTFAIDSVVYSELFTHSKYAALTLKDAIVDQFREKLKERPSIDIEYPDVRIHLHISGNGCQISLDSSGRSLHQRGYRTQHGGAPLNEVLAAGMIKLSGWDEKIDFMDPMCGSGTLPIEAALIATNTAPGLLNPQFGFKNWLDYKPKLWLKLLEEAKEAQTAPKCQIFGFDKSNRTLQIAAANVGRAGMQEHIELKCKDFESNAATSEAGILITNPPYGERLKEENLIKMYQMMGDRFKQHFAGWEAWVLGSDREAMKFIGLRPSRKIQLFNGALDCRFMKFALYRGSKKQKHQTSD